jgi:hypothetical protein
MNEDQKFQTGLCRAHAGCRFVMTLFDTCSGVKNYVGKLGLGSKSSGATVNDAVVEAALGNSGLTSAKISNCLFSFDRSLCRQHLGLEAPPPSTSSTPSESYKAPRKTELLDLTRVLKDEQQRTKTGLPAYFDARSALTGCENAKDTRDQDSVCAIAQSRVKECNEFRDGWYKRRDSVLEESSKEGIPDLVASLRPLEMLGCPNTLPGSGLTVDQALAEWSKTKASTNDMITRCDGLRREASAAIDEAPSKAADAVAAFETSCARVRAEYAATAQAFRKRIEMQGTPKVDSAAVPDDADPSSTAPPRRGSSSATQLFNESIASNEVRIKEQAAEAERARQAQRNSELARKAEAERAAVLAQQQRLQTNTIQSQSTQSGQPTGGDKQCIAAMNAFLDAAGAIEAMQAQNKYVGEVLDRKVQGDYGRRNMENEVWLYVQRLRFAEESKACANAPTQIAYWRMRLQESQQKCNCGDGMGHYFDARRVSNAFGQNLNATSNVAEQSTPTSAGGQGFEACKDAALNNPQFAAAMKRLPSNSATLQARGGIVGIDLAIKDIKQCPSDPRSAAVIEGLQRQRAAALLVCRQISATDNCLVSPF